MFLVDALRRTATEQLTGSNPVLTTKKLNIMKTKISYFICAKNELERIEEGLKMRNLDVDLISIISITENVDTIKIWYKTL